MEKLSTFGRIIFGCGLIGFGILQFVFDDYILGRAPAWPWNATAGFIWAYVTGFLFLGTGVSIVRNKHVRLLALSAALIVFFWAFLRQIPLVAADPDFTAVWTRGGKAMVLCGGLLAIAGISQSVRGAGWFSLLVNSRDSLIHSGRVTLGLFMVLTGTQHFLFSESVSTLVPTWIPWAMFWTYFAGVALILGGFGLLIPKTAWLSAPLSGLMIFLWVLMLHIPNALGAADGRNEWTAVFEALTLAGLAFVLAGFFRKKNRNQALY